MLDVPRDLIWFVSGLLAGHRRQIGTRRGTRRLGCYRQALSALAWFRDKGDIPRLGRGFGLPQSTAYRYLGEVIEVLAARAPGLAEQLERALAEGVPYLILDGKVVDTGRCREKTLSRKGKVIDLRYAGKTHDFGGNIQALFYPCGIPLWISGVLPGNVHYLTAAQDILPGPQRADPLSALPGRARLRAIDPALENAPACHCQPGQDRSHRPRRARPGAIRAQDDHVKVVGETSLSSFCPASRNQCGSRAATSAPRSSST